MIATKHCDVCDVELPPMAFQPSYECCDVALHPKHPDASFSQVRINASPRFTNGSGDRRVDLCPDCFLRLCEALVKRVQKRNGLARKDLERWKTWRLTSKSEEIEREGCNQKKP